MTRWRGVESSKKIWIFVAFFFSQIPIEKQICVCICIFIYIKSENLHLAWSAHLVVCTKYYADPLDIFPKEKYNSLFVHDISPSDLVTTHAQSHYYEIVIS